jgi:predicted DNA-binding protein (UPF0251 family)
MRRDPHLLGLTQAEAIALTALLRHGSLSSAADSLGIAYRCLQRRLERARKKTTHGFLINELLWRFDVGVPRSRPPKRIDEPQQA